MRGTLFPTLGFEGGTGQPGCTELQGRVCLLAPGWCWGCTCCWVSALSPPQLWHSSSAEPQPRFCVVSLHPRVHPWPCSAVLSRPRLALGALDLPRIVPGLGCVVSVPCVSSTEGERLGGWWESSVPWQGSPLSTGPSHLWDPRRGPWWRRGHSMSWQLPSAGHSLSSFPQVCAGCWGCPACPVPCVCPWCSCLAEGNACCSIPGLSCQPALSSRDPAPSGAWPVPPARSLPWGCGWQRGV